MKLAEYLHIAGVLYLWANYMVTAFSTLPVKGFAKQSGASVNVLTRGNNGRMASRVPWGFQGVPCCFEKHDAIRAALETHPHRGGGKQVVSQKRQR